jgi:hypothetical protein
MRNRVDPDTSASALVEIWRFHMAEVVGRICFTADRRKLLFAPDNIECASRHRYPWSVLSDGSALRKFMETFAPTRLQSGRAVFVYRVRTTSDALDEWFAQHAQKVDAA